MTDLTRVICLVYANCMEANVARLHAAVAASDWALAQSLAGYVIEDAANIAEELAPGTVPATTEDAYVVPVEECPTLAEWSYVIAREV